MRGHIEAGASAAFIHEHEENSMRQGRNIEQTARIVGEKPLHEHGSGGKHVRARGLRVTWPTCGGMHAECIDPFIVSERAVFCEANCKPRIVL